MSQIAQIVLSDREAYGTEGGEGCFAELTLLRDGTAKTAGTARLGYEPLMDANAVLMPRLGTAGSFGGTCVLVIDTGRVKGKSVWYASGCTRRPKSNPPRKPGLHPKNTRQTRR